MRNSVRLFVPLALGGVLLLALGCTSNAGPVTPATSDQQPTGAEPEPGSEPTLSEEGP